jgi:hypothetical protein
LRSPPAVEPNRAKATNSNGITDDPIDHAALPSYLTGDKNGRIFLVTGPVSGLTSLEEMFHP